ncbi:MAG: PQQ-binding-like beta-propeller repeat protein [Planctomycetota bacterium]
MPSLLFGACQRLLAGLSLFALTASVHAADWPQHLGPTQDAVSAETGLLDKWPASGPPELWRHDVGQGYAGTAVVDGKVFLNDRQQGVADILRVFDLDTGKELWRYTHPARGRVNYPGSRSTPSVSQTHVFLTGGLGHVHAINRETQKPDWTFNIYDRYPDGNKMFGFAPSPVLVDNRLLVSPGAEGDPVVVAINTKTGKTAWASEATIRNTQHTQHTPVVRTINGVRGITARDQTHVYFIDIATGKTLLTHKVYNVQPGPHVTIPPVTVIGKSNQYVFVTNGYENGSVMLEVQKTAAGMLAARELYRIPEGGQVHPAIYHDKHLYLNINENANLFGRSRDGGLACIDANTGEVQWNTRNSPNLNRGATAFADGKLYAFNDDTGELLLINPNPNRFELVSKVLAIKPRGRKNEAWSPIVISDGRLVIRDHQQIVCYDLREKK